VTGIDEKTRKTGAFVRIDGWRSTTRSQILRGPMNVTSLRFAAALMTMASGWILVLAGYVAYTGSPLAAVVITLPSGPIILLALATAARADAVDGDTAVAARPLVPGVAVIAVTLLSGAVMFFAGCAIAAWGWALVLPITTVGGLLILIAFALERR